MKGTQSNPTTPTQVSSGTQNLLTRGVGAPVNQPNVGAQPKTGMSGWQQALYGAGLLAMLGTAAGLGALGMYVADKKAEQVQTPQTRPSAGRTIDDSIQWGADETVARPIQTRSPYVSPSPSGSRYAAGALPSPSSSASPSPSPTPPASLVSSAETIDLGAHGYFAAALPNDYQVKIAGGNFDKTQIHAVKGQGKTIETIVLANTETETKAEISKLMLSADRKYVVWQEGFNSVVKVGMITQDNGTYGLSVISSKQGGILALRGNLLLTENREGNEVVYKLQFPSSF